MKEDMFNHIAFAASNNADTLNYNQAMKAPGVGDFQN